MSKVIKINTSCTFIFKNVCKWCFGKPNTKLNYIFFPKPKSIQISKNRLTNITLGNNNSRDKNIKKYLFISIKEIKNLSKFNYKVSAAMNLSRLEETVFMECLTCDCSKTKWAYFDHTPTDKFLLKKKSSNLITLREVE